MIPREDIFARVAQLEKELAEMRQQQLLAPRYVYSWEAVAREMGCSVKTAKKLCAELGIKWGLINGKKFIDISKIHQKMQSLETYPSCVVDGTAGQYFKKIKK